VAGAHLHERLQQLAEVTPVHGLVGGGHVVVVQRARHAAGLCLRGHRAQPQRRGGAARNHRALQEIAAPVVLVVTRGAVRCVVHAELPPVAGVSERRLDAERWWRRCRNRARWYHRPPRAARPNRRLPWTSTRRCARHSPRGSSPRIPCPTPRWPTSSTARASRPAAATARAGRSSSCATTRRARRWPG